MTSKFQLNSAESGPRFVVPCNSGSIELVNQQMLTLLRDINLSYMHPRSGAYQAVTATACEPLDQT